jgi:hypothetical protein
MELANPEEEMEESSEESESESEWYWILPHKSL